MHIDSASHNRHNRRNAMNALTSLRNDMVFIDDDTSIELVQPIIDRLAKEGVIYHPGHMTTGVWTITDGIWKLTPESLLEVCDEYSMTSENPIIYGTVPGDLRGSGSGPNSPDDTVWFQIQRDFLDTTSTDLARDAAEDMIRVDYVQDENGVDRDSEGNDTVGWVNCPLIVVDSNTVGFAGFRLIVDAIRNRQKEVREEEGVDLATLQVFVHNGSADTLRPLDEFPVNTH